VDFDPIERAILDIEKRASNLDEITRSVDTIKNASENILKRVRIDREALEKQVTLLRDSMISIKHVLGKDEDSPAEA
jgi:hypothetical protein